MSGLRIAVTRLGLAVTTIVAAYAAVRDEIAWLGRQPAADHLHGWSASEDERLQRGLHAWYPMFDGLRKAVPASAVLGGWLPLENLPADATETFDLIRMALAPRICVPVRDPDYLFQVHPELPRSGLPVFFVEMHPWFWPQGLGGRRPARLDPAFGELVLVADQSEFTLHALRSPR